MVTGSIDEEEFLLRRDASRWTEKSSDSRFYEKQSASKITIASRFKFSQGMFTRKKRKLPDIRSNLSQYSCSVICNIQSDVINCNRCS